MVREGRWKRETKKRNERQTNLDTTMHQFQNRKMGATEGKCLHFNCKNGLSLPYPYIVNTRHLLFSPSLCHCIPSGRYITHPALSTSSHANCLVIENEEGKGTTCARMPSPAPSPLPSSRITLQATHIQCTNCLGCLSM